MYDAAADHCSGVLVSPFHCTSRYPLEKCDHSDTFDTVAIVILVTLAGISGSTSVMCSTVVMLLSSYTVPRTFTRLPELTFTQF